MKIYIANESKQVVGGGWSFLRNFKDFMPQQGYVFVDIPEQADLFFLPSASMVNKPLFERLEQLQKPIILRIDNVIRDSRNRGCGMSRMLKYARSASAIIFQSQWAYDYIGYWLWKNGVNKQKCFIILNGVNTQVFFSKGTNDPNVFVYSRYNRDETKNFDEAWFLFLQEARKNPEAQLRIIGQFSPENIQYQFDFFDNEQIEYLGIIQDQKIYADILQQAGTFYAPYFNDACSNAILEARASGCHIHTGWSGMTGGTPEVLKPNLDIRVERMCYEYHQLFESLTK